MLDIGRVAFLTEMQWEGKVPQNHINKRTEFCWMEILNADHFPIERFDKVRQYDHVFIIFPKGKLFVNAEGSTVSHGENPYKNLLSNYPLFIQMLKCELSNKQVHYIQEGPHWWFNDYDIIDQFNFYNMLFECDSIFTHNQSDVNFYEGLFPNKKIRPIRSLMFDDQIKQYRNNIKENKCIIGGNFARWYGGFQSYIVALNFDVPVWTQTSHAMRENENEIENLNHLPRLMWNDWMKELSKFKFAVHLMPTVAAGTFSLNCGYLYLPCIGNEKVDTQRLLHPLLSVDIDDVEKARKLAIQLKIDKDFYNECSNNCGENYEKYYTPEIWMKDMKSKLNEQ